MQVKINVYLQTGWWPLDHARRARSPFVHLRSGMRYQTTLLLRLPQGRLYFTRHRSH